jgi:SPP1 family predicted phage head-tail adaptor
LGVKIAELRHRIKFQSLSRASDGQGGWTETWTDHAEVWAKIVPKSARERFFSQQVQPTISHEVSIRSLDGLTSEMRIFFDDRIFQIHGIRRENEERWFMILDCEEGVGS